LARDRAVTNNIQWG